MELPASARRLTMYKYIAVCLTLCGVVVGDLNLEEGAPCEWDGVKGQCVEQTRCLSDIDVALSVGQPVCSTKGDVKIVCCTYCDLVNDTRTLEFLPIVPHIRKDGNKARESCQEYLKTLPYECRDKRHYNGIIRAYNNMKKCHDIRLFQFERTKYPHQAVLGYGEEFSSADWLAGGTILSERFILTAAHTGKVYPGYEVKFVALNVQRISDPSSWQPHNVKRFITYPGYKEPYKYHDIALIETVKPITFSRDVLPACLYFKEKSEEVEPEEIEPEEIEPEEIEPEEIEPEEIEPEEAKSITWRDVKRNDYDSFADTLQTINLDKIDDDDCMKVYGIHRLLPKGIDNETQMCYGSWTHAPEACMGLSGEPLMVKYKFSACIHMVIGVTSFGRGQCGHSSQKPDVFTRVGYYKSWIESVVWPEPKMEKGTDMD